MAMWHSLLISLRDYLRLDKGTLTAAKVKTGWAAGAMAGTLYNTSLTGNLKAGDVFTIAGDSAVYSVTKDVTAADNEVTVEFYPPLYQAALADAVVTLEDIPIYAGAINPNDIEVTKGAIILMRDSETSEQIQTVGNSGMRGDCSLLIECWTRSDEADPADGYKKLSILEDKLTAAIYNWGVAVGKSFTGGSIMNIVIGETRGDQDSMRPNLGSQKTIKINWSKNN